jgi:hypothetical protein
MNAPLRTQPKAEPVGMLNHCIPQGDSCVAHVRCAPCAMTKIFTCAAQDPHFFALIRTLRIDRCAKSGRKFRGKFVALKRRAAPL